MGSLSKALNEQNVSNEDTQPEKVDGKKFDLTSDEVKFILATLSLLIT